MIEWTSTPYLWGPISSHGAFMAIGMALAALLGRRDAKRNNLNVDRFDNAALLAILGGVFGARLVYVLLHLDSYQTVWEIFHVWEGGISSFGGILGGILAAIGYLKWKKENWIRYADAIGPHILIGWGVGRIGDLILWSEFGTPTGLPWGFAVDGDVPRHPTQIYTLINLSLLWGMVLFYRTKLKQMGEGMLFYVSLILYFGHRLLIEFIRDYPGETSVIDYRLFAQVISFLFVVICVWNIRRIVRKSD